MTPPSLTHPAAALGASATAVTTEQAAAESGVATSHRARRGWSAPIARILNLSLDTVIVLWIGVTVTFFALKLVPGDPVEAVVAGLFDITPELRTQVTAYYGLDRPLLEQYATHLSHLLVGDLGRSYQRNLDVSTLLLSELPDTLALAGSAMLVAIVIAMVAASATAGRNRIARFFAQALELVALSMPSFWLGILLIMAFAFGWPIFPAFGTGTPQSVVLPALTLGIPIGAMLGQMLRERMEYVLHEPFVSTVRARGVGETALRVRHLLRHASVPTLTLGGVIFGSLLSGVAVVETLFGRPGVGRIAVTAIESRDLPVVVGVVIFSALGFVIVNAVVDLLYPLLDPRLKGGAK